MIRAGVGRRAAAGVVVLGLSATLGACVSIEEYDGSFKAAPTTAPLPIQRAAISEDIVKDGMEVTVLDISPFDQSPFQTPRINVIVRTENLSRVPQQNPDIELLCDETTNAGDWYLGSTFEPNALLPVNAVSEGETIIGFPLKGKNPEYSVVSCTTPRIRLTIRVAGIEAPSLVEIPVSDDVISAATRRPRGPNLPLPLKGA